MGNFVRFSIIFRFYSIPSFRCYFLVARFFGGIFEPIDHRAIG